MKLSTPWLVMALSVGGCAAGATASSSPTSTGSPEAVAAAKEGVGKLKSSLREALSREMGRGAEHAVAVCRDEAPRLAANLSGQGLVIGRTSDKLRNPANAPRAWVAPLLNDPAVRALRPGEHHIVQLPEGRIGYVEPISVAAPCLRCHGDPAGPVADAIRSAYPDDRAVGYSAGEFRGLFWAEADAR